MKLLVISDLHLGPFTQTLNQQFLEFLQQAFQQRNEILIAGDLFELWFGWPDLTFDYQNPILDTMLKLASEGLVMDYVEGNHDFRISYYRGKIFREVHPRHLTRGWSGKHLYVEHGDLINKQDLMYRLWRAVSKNPISFFLLDHLSRKFLLRIGRQLEQGMKHTNLKYKLHYPEEACKKFYLEQFHKGADIVIIGHFHQEKEVSTQLTNRNVLFYNLPGWEHGLRYLVIPEGDQMPHFEEWGKANGNSSTT